jgi:citrate synthase
LTLPVKEAVMDEYVSAEEAAAMLGVAVDTVYVYVSRKGIRSIPTPNSSKRRYWRADVERARRRGGRSPAIAGDLKQESAITLHTEEDLYYRGRSVRELTESASFEEVAALLWDVEEKEAFTEKLPASAPTMSLFTTAFASESTVNQALALFPLLEAANPRSYDLSQVGMARTGADILRCLCALILGKPHPAADPIHATFGETLGLSPEDTDLLRRLLILSADHGLDSATFAVRAVASTGVSPWRSILTGLSVKSGQRGKLTQYGGVRQLITEIMGAKMASEPVMRRVQEGEAIPGFQPPEASRADARVRILSDRLHTTMSADKDFQHIEAAARAVHEIQGLEPTFAYLSGFAWWKVGLRSNIAPFLLGRSAGWVAHAIEQYQGGERERAELHYRGPLPPQTPK